MRRLFLPLVRENTHRLISGPSQPVLGEEFRLPGIRVKREHLDERHDAS